MKLYTADPDSSFFFTLVLLQFHLAFRVGKIIISLVRNYDYYFKSDDDIRVQSVAGFNDDIIITILLLLLLQLSHFHAFFLSWLTFFLLCT